MKLFPSLGSRHPESAPTEIVKIQPRLVLSVARASLDFCDQVQFVKEGTRKVLFLYEIPGSVDKGRFADSKLYGRLHIPTPYRSMGLTTFEDYEKNKKVKLPRTVGQAARMMDDAARK